MLWDRTNRPVWLRCTLGVLLAIIAAVIRLQFLGILELRVPYLTSYPAVAVAALYGGFGAGLLAAVVSAALADYFWMEPVGQFGITNSADLLSIGVFLASCTLIAYLAEAAYRAQARAHKAEEHVKLAAEREKAALDLRQSETKYRELVQNANSAIIRWKRDGTLTFFNEYAQKFFGYSAEEVIGKSVNILMPERESTGGDLTGLLQDIVNHPEKYANNMNENLLRDGSRVWMAWTNRPVFDQDGQVREILAVASDITERKRAEEELDRSREWFQVTLSSIGDAVIATDASGLVTFLNPVAAKLTGWEPEAALHQPVQNVFRIINEQTRQVARNVVERVLYEGNIVNLANHTALITRDGREIPIEDSAAPIRDNAGNLTGVVLVFHDVTGKRQAQKALQESESRFRRFVTLAPIPLCFVNKEGVLVYFNDRFTQLFGYTKDDVPTLEEWWQLAYPDEQYRRWVLDRWGAAVRRAAEEKTDIEPVEYTVSCKNGEVRLVEISGITMEDNFLATFIDITERKRAETELREGRSRLDLALRSAQMGVWRLDLNENKRHFDDQVCNLLGIAPAKFTGTEEEFYKVVHPDDREMLNAALARTIEQDVPYETEYRAVWPDGSVHYIIARAKLFRDKTGQPLRVNGLIWDITERKRTEAALQETQSRLLAELAAMKRLHQIGTRFVRNGELGKVLEEVVEAAIAITGSDMGNMQLLDISGALKIVAHRGFERPFLDFFNSDHEGHAACGTTLQRGKRVIIEDIAESAVFAGSPAREVVLASGARAVQSTPLCSRSGHLLGMLSTHYKTQRRPDERDLLFIDMLSQQIGDMLEHMRMEEDLRKSRDELELRVRERTAELVIANEDLQKQAALLNLAHDAIFVVDSADVVSFWNKGAEDLYGFTRQQAIGNVADELLQTRSQESLEQVVNQVIDKGHWAGELRQTTSRGEELVVESRWALRPGENGKPAGFLEVNRDITSRKIIEEELRKTDRAFRTLSECNQAMMRQTEETELLQQVCQIVVDVGGYRMAWVGFAENDENKTVLTIASAGYDHGYLDQAQVTWADTERGRGPTGTAIRTGKIITSQNALLNPAYGPWRSEGTRRGYVSSIALPLIVEKKVIGTLTIYASEPDAFDEGEAGLLSNLAENLAYGIASIRAAEQRRRSEEELRINASRLELVNAELQEFAFVASHDLQEPLRKIQTFCDMAQKRCALVLDSTSKDYLDRVVNSAGRMRQLLRDLLDFSRVATRLEPFKKIDLVKIVREAADVFEVSVKETGCSIEIENMPAIEADESQMLGLFQNLIGNALKFRGGETPRIKVYGKLDGKKICEIFVKDNGIGFDPKFVELIFKPFQRLHSRNEYEGTGMGLAICRKIVERHGGSIGAESELGKGSTFIIRLPAKQDRWEGI